MIKYHFKTFRYVFFSFEKSQRFGVFMGRNTGALGVLRYELWQYCCIIKNIFTGKFFFLIFFNILIKLYISFRLLCDYASPSI